MKMTVIIDENDAKAIIKKYTLDSLRVPDTHHVLVEKKSYEDNYKVTITEKTAAAIDKQEAETETPSAVTDDKIDLSELPF